MSFDVNAIRADFPILSQKIGGHQLVYLDNAATTQKPQVVIDTLSKYYELDNANIHRGVHTLSQRATEHYEDARQSVATFLGAKSVDEIIFLRGTTEAINLVANTYGRANLGPGDEVVVSWLEHHSNIVPWQLVCQATGATLKVLPIDDDGAIIEDEIDQIISSKTKMVAITHMSNALGTITPLKRIIERAHECGAKVLVDGAQSIPHIKVNVQELGADFYCFSGHKVYGPTGVGVLWGRKELLDAMPPWQGGGEMIRSVTFQGTTYNEVPHKFEAGTPNIAGGIGLGAALEYVGAIGLDAIAAHEHELLSYATKRALEIDGLRIIGTAPHKASVLSFELEGIHPHDVGTLLDQEGIAIRTGHHCAQPVMDRFKVPATNRASFAMYNTMEEVDALMAGIEKIKGYFA